MNPFMQGIGNLFGGGMQGLLSPEEQQQAQSGSLIASGLAMMNASQGGQIGTGRVGLGEALQAGLQGGQGAFQGMIQNKLSVEDVLEKRRLKQSNREVSNMVFGDGGLDPMNGEEGLKKLDSGIAKAFKDQNMDMVEKLMTAREKFYPQAEGFTLGAGDVRFDGKGNVIARGADEIPNEIKVLNALRSDPELLAIELQRQNAKSQKVSIGGTQDPTINLPAGVQKAEDADFEKYMTIQQLNEDLQGALQTLATKAYPTGLGGEMMARGMSALGMGGEEVEALNEITRFEKRFTNDSLRLNNGVQTEGDAIRAIEELKAARTPEAKIKAFQELNRINTRAAQLIRESIVRRRQNIGLGVPPVMPQPVTPATVRLTADPEENKRILKRLPSGSQYIDSKGNIAIKG